MKKRLVRCHKAYAETQGTYNHEVFDTVSRSLMICQACGEIFFFDRENPQLGKTSVYKMVGTTLCPSCSSSLSESLIPYPENFLTQDGRWGVFSPPMPILLDEDGEILSLWELKPIASAF